MKNFGTIDGIRKLKIRVIQNENDVIYEGMVENAPDNIKQMPYHDIKMLDCMTLYV